MTGVPEDDRVNGAARTTEGHRVTVILVAYRTRDLIMSCLAGLPDDCDVIVVDNAPGDGTAEEIETRFPHVTVIRAPENLGFARAVNVGAAHAHTPYLLLLNPDTELIGDPVTALADHATANPAHGIYTGRTLRGDGTDDGGSVFGLPSLWGYLCFATGLSSLFRRSAVFNPEELPGLDRSVGGPVPAASGCVMLIERDLFQRLGGFEPQYFMYSEDVDMCHRAGLLGRVPVLVPHAKVTHIGGASSSVANKRVMVLRGKVTYTQLRWNPLSAALSRYLLRSGVRLRAQAAPGWAEVWDRRAEWLAGWPPPTGSAKETRPGAGRP